MLQTKHLVVGVFMLMLASMCFAIYLMYRADISARDSALDYKNATYTVGGERITLKDGIAERESAPGSASKVITRYFGNEIRKDLNGDGKEDVMFIMTQEGGGSGTFYYAVAGIKTDTGYQGSDALFLGDRIAPQSTESGPERSVIVTYADRAPGESFDVQPSVGKSVRVLLNPETMSLGEWVEDFEGESTITPGTETGRMGAPGTPQPPVGKIKADMFTGTLEKVDVGCFADGECYVVVDGKHVTAIMGWSQETVGTVQGVEGFGDLESHIGEKVEVYARDNSDGTYSLYGSEGFYIKLLGGKQGSGASGSDGNAQGITIGEPNPSTPKPVASGGCMVGGCSGQLCGESKNPDDMMSTCEYREQYACYKSASCERQANGQCGWTMDTVLTQCLNTKAGGAMDLEVQ